MGVNLSYHNKETLLFTIDPYHGNLNWNPIIYYRSLFQEPRPDGANNIQSILKELLEDEGQLKEYNSTFQELAAAQEGAADSDPLAKFLSDPQAVWSWLQSNDKTQELMQIMQGSVLFDKLLKIRE